MHIRDRTTRLLAVLGSGEFEPWTAPLDRMLLTRATGSGRVALLPTASAPDGEGVFALWGRKGLQHYAALGVEADVFPCAAARTLSMSSWLDAWQAPR